MPLELPETGKVSRGIFDEIILPHLGKSDKSVLVGPQHGVDVGIVDIGGGRVMALTTDPVFIVPQYGWKRAAWFAVHILASDAATSGLAPTYMTVDLNLPPSMRRSDFEEMWLTFSSEAKNLGIAIVAGHTGRYTGCDYPMVGGATVMSVGSKDKYVTPKGALVGDKIIITKGCAIEAAGLFAATFQSKVATVFGECFARKSDDIFYQMSVVEDCMTAVSVGVRDDGVTAMHDATECGVWGGLFEVAEASGVGMAIDKKAIIIQDAVAKICGLFNIDPYSSISEGTLVMTCRPHKAKEVVTLLADMGIPSSVVGEVVPRDEGVSYTENGVKTTLVHPQVDPFWAAFDREMKSDICL
jgi:hydrogenase expression/formation protein HypE